MGAFGHTGCFYLLSVSPKTSGFDRAPTEKVGTVVSAQLNDMARGLYGVDLDIMLRISVKDTGPEATRVRLDGKISGEWVDELGRECLFLLDCGRTVTLDLAGVTFADYRGAESLRHLADRGVALENGSVFVQSLIAGGITMHAGLQTHEPAPEKDAG